MRNLTLVLIASAAFGFGAAAMYLVMRRPAPSMQPAAASTPDADGRKALYWYDPMKPDRHFDKPGKSPFMDMPLLPKYADEAAAGGEVRIDPRIAQNLGVRTARVVRGVLSRPLRATGTLAFDERAIVAVPSRVAGIVEKLFVRAPLTAVRRGEPLATLLAPDWTAAQEDYVALRGAPSGNLDALRSAARRRLVLLGMDEGSIRALERGGRAQVRFTIAAPRDGVVADLAVREGAGVAAGAPLLTLNGLDTVWINAAVAETDAAQIAAGAAVAVTLPAFPGERFSGSIETLLPDLDAATRTRRARIVLANPQHRLVPGMFATVEIASAGTAPQLLVPSEAVIATGTRNVVIAAAGGGRYRAREVRIGAQGGDKTAVLEGLAEGDDVVLSGQFLIDSEASLSGVLSRLGVEAPGTTNESAPPPASPVRHAASGTVERIDGTHWSIAADPIASPGMDAMTMDFLVPAAVTVDGIRPGRRVGFDFVRNADGEFEIVHLAALDAPAPRGRP